MSQGKSGGSATGTSGSNSGGFENELMGFLFGNPASGTSSTSQPMSQTMSQPGAQSPVNSGISQGISNGISNLFASPTQQPTQTAHPAYPMQSTMPQRTAPAPAQSPSSNLLGMGYFGHMLGGGAGSGNNANNSLPSPQESTMQSSDPLQSIIGYSDQTSGGGAFTGPGNFNIPSPTDYTGGQDTGSWYDTTPVEPTYDTSSWDSGGGDFGGDF